jgi:hypothetical protein
VQVDKVNLTERLAEWLEKPTDRGGKAKKQKQAPAKAKAVSDKATSRLAATVRRPPMRCRCVDAELCSCTKEEGGEEETKQR